MGNKFVQFQLCNVIGIITQKSLRCICDIESICRFYDTFIGTASRAARCGSFVEEVLGHSDVSNGGTWWRQKIYVVQAAGV
jgi:hypothetical protein